MSDLCPVCGSTNAVERFPAQIETLNDAAFSYAFGAEHRKTLRVVRCRDCTHQFCSPIPSDVSSHYVSDEIDRDYLAHSESRILSARAMFDALPRFASGAKLLDVGCATGDFLVVARERGLDATGVELSPWSAAIARERGFVVHEQPLAEVHGESLFDVIAMVGVIEHFTDPAEQLRHVHRLLTPNGIFAGWTGDVASITSRLLGRRWWYWQGQHLQYFTRRSLAELLRRTSFATPAITSYPFVATRTSIAHSLTRYRGHGVMSMLLRPLFALKPIWTLRIPGEMLFIAQRLEPTTTA